jgi:hypothetical protein
VAIFTFIALPLVAIWFVSVSVGGFDGGIKLSSFSCHAQDI